MPPVQLMSSVYLTGNTLTGQSSMSVNHVKNVYFQVGVLKYISANLLKIAVKRLNLSINFVKNELLHNRLLRILRASIYWILHMLFYVTYTFSLLALALIKCTFCFFYPSLKKRNCLLPIPFLTIYHYSLFPLSEGFEKHIWDHFELQGRWSV